jgi:hypothetical protein
MASVARGVVAALVVVFEACNGEAAKEEDCGAGFGHYSLAEEFLKIKFIATWKDL